MDWLLEGEWFKNCNCDPGCPCDFNQHPTHANCEGVVAMRIERGHVDGVDLSGLCWAATVWWPGRMDEGNGRLQLLIDERGTPEQREALVRALATGEGDTLMDIVRAVCPIVEEVLYVPFEWEFDLTAVAGGSRPETCSRPRWRRCAASASRRRRTRSWSRSPAGSSTRATATRQKRRLRRSSR